MIPTDRLAALFVEVADTLVYDYDVVDVLHRLTVAVAELSGAAAAGLLLSDQQGELQFMASSDDAVEALELFQLQNSDGPCLDCFNSGEPVVNADLARAGDTWPVFAPRAIELGFESVHAFPMRLREQVIGALNLFGSAAVRFDPEDVRVVQALADMATIAILQERSLSRAEALTEQLQGALTSRVVIEQAKGALSRQAGVGIDDAFGLLRERARRTQTRLVDVARAVLDDVPTDR